MNRTFNIQHSALNFEVSEIRCSALNVECSMFGFSVHGGAECPSMVNVPPANECPRVPFDANISTRTGCDEELNRRDAETQRRQKLRSQVASLRLYSAVKSSVAFVGSMPLGA